MLSLRHSLPRPVYWAYRGGIWIGLFVALERDDRNMYSYKSRIRYSELDETGHLRLESLLDYFQDCSTFHSEDVGLGVEHLKEHGLVWVMSSWQIIVERYPRICENVTVGTVPYEFKGFVGYRNFLMTDGDGKWLAWANTIWSLLDTKSGKPARVSEDLVKRYGLGPKLPMDYAPRRIQLPEEMERQEAVQVRAHHLDTNHHVNNGQFVRIAMDSLGMDCHVRQLRAEYKKQAVLGNVLVPWTAAEDGKQLVALKDEAGTVYCIVELQEDRSSLSGDE